MAVYYSLDVKNLFNTPTATVKDIIQHRLNSTQLHSDYLDECLHLLELCYKQNMSKFNNIIWGQQIGLAMGSPLFPIIC